ncbi:DUF4307 domain-containing protein [Rhodococcus xishaensis]|uniref:DUF4307 domain-containing protein n=1 Tax=Rhodococcus xishaensis TaxID=2487364 RepID=A0A3S3CPY7_9NOCA|nr:DUF4307 domain-containing protein [Rhodococcus xishaensis]RVW02871.1 DUF4307 domain-containing protein [Rhodococcus xishaensis]
MSSTPPTDRYGSAPRTLRSGTWVKWVLTGLVVVAGIGIAFIGYNKFAVNEIEGKQIYFDIIDNRTMDIEFTVTRDDPSQPAVCIIRTRSKDGSETGRREVYIAPSTDSTVKVTAPVQASQPPAMGDLYGCSLDVPGYLHAG